jgi:hypothetical protein
MTKTRTVGYKRSKKNEKDRKKKIANTVELILKVIFSIKEVKTKKNSTTISLVGSLGQRQFWCHLVGITYLITSFHPTSE